MKPLLATKTQINEITRVTKQHDIACIFIQSRTPRKKSKKRNPRLGLNESRALWGFGGWLGFNFRERK